MYINIDSVCVYVWNNYILGKIGDEYIDMSTFHAQESQHQPMVGLE